MPRESFRIPDAREIEKLYGFYKMIFDSGFSLAKRRSVMTWVLGGEPWSWRVTSISESAVRAIAMNDFRKPANFLARDHIKPRAETFNEVLSCPMPLEIGDWWEIVWNNDKTKLVTNDEHHRRTDESRLFSVDPDLSLFTDAPTAGFYFTKNKEGAFVRDLVATYGLTL